MLEELADKLLEAVYGDIENLNENLQEAVKGYDDELIIKAFCCVTSGKFIEHKSFPNCKILNKFPNIVVRPIHGKSTIEKEYMYIFSKTYYIHADQKRPCYKIPWTLNNDSDDTNGIRFEDENKLNYDFHNLTKKLRRNLNPRKPKLRRRNN